MYDIVFYLCNFKRWKFWKKKTLGSGGHVETKAMF